MALESKEPLMRTTPLSQCQASSSGTSSVVPRQV